MGDDGSFLVKKMVIDINVNGKMINKVLIVKKEYLDDYGEVLVEIDGEYVKWICVFVFEILYLNFSLKYILV